jgi:CheY-like chemotaxis protein
MARKLLLADDSITIQKVVELILAEEGFEIKATSNGEEALAAISSFNPDIILADIEMPKINGYQLCEHIKQDPSISGIPVILLAGAFEPIDEELARRVNADDFIVKPFESQDLISKINAALTASSVMGGKEVESIVEAEAVGVDELSMEEDLWAMEEIPETAEVGSWDVEEGAEVGTEELAEMVEETKSEAEPALTEEPVTPVFEKAEAEEEKIRISEAELPSKDEIKQIFENAINKNLSSFLSSFDIKEAILTPLTPLLKDSVEKIIWEVAPDLIERMLKEMLKGSLESLTKEVEKVIWETVPDLAETMISKEIERIRSEF